jgi:TnpA family transposase
MVTQSLVMPSAYRFRRCLITAQHTIREEENEYRLTRLEKSLDVSIRDTPLIKRWTAARELLRYPSAALGRANLPKMAEEYHIFRELSISLLKNELNPQVLLENPDCEELFHFVERHPPSILNRWEKRKILEALPFYLAYRLQESIDAVLICFVRKARLLRSRISEEVEDDRREESLALLERSSHHLRDIQIAIGEALSIGSPTPLQPFQKKLSRLYKDGMITLDKNRLYHLIGSRGAYTRKLAHRLVGIQFQGHEPHAKVLVEILQEILAFAPFDRKIPKDVVEKLTFLQIPQSLLVQRQVFEPVVMITLADYLWSGRVTVSMSRRFSNMWACVPTNEIQIDPVKWVSHRRKQLNKAWTIFEKEATTRDLVKEGRLHIQKPPRRLSSRADIMHQKRHEALVSKFNPVSIFEVVFSVNKSTNYLDEFKLRKQSSHKLQDEERLRATSGILLAIGMNIGIREMPIVLNNFHSVGRIQNIMENYMTKENLEAALKRLIQVWDERKMGKLWGPGQLVSVDGRVIGAFQNNLLSRYHYRKGRSGMTVYWFRRDDGIATRVKSLGNQEWEAWHVLDELLHPLTSQDLHASCGDTQGQFLALWSLSSILGKEIFARFRRPSRVLLFKPSAKNRADLKNLRTIRWDIIERGLPSIFRLAQAIKEDKVQASDILRRWYLYDDTGCDVAEVLRELGKVDRTEFLLRYACDMNLQYKIRDACNDAEAWNSFHEAIFWGNGGKLRSNNPDRHEETLLALTLLMDSIVFYNVDKYGMELKKAKAPTPVIWDHIQVLGKYQFRRRWI